MDKRSKEAIEKILHTTGVRVSKEADSPPIYEESRTLTSNQTIEMFSIPLPYTIVLSGPDASTLEHKAVIYKIVQILAAHC